MTWTVSNNDDSPLVIITDSRGVPFNPDPVAPHGETSATEAIHGPDDDQAITETITVQHASGETSEYSVTITAAACNGPDVPPEVSFTFDKTASASTARVGDTLQYRYCGQNTSDIPLEVVRLVDDRLGVVIELPDVETVVAPGDSLCNTDIGLPVSYDVVLSDLGTTITNSAVVTVRTQEATPREFQATATTSVEPFPFRRVCSKRLTPDNKTWVCHRTLSDTTRTT